MSTEKSDQNRNHLDMDIGSSQIHFVVSPEQYKKFCDALDKPPQFLPALQDLFSRPSPFHKEGQ